MFKLCNNCLSEMRFLYYMLKACDPMKVCSIVKSSKLGCLGYRETCLAACSE